MYKALQICYLLSKYSLSGFEVSGPGWAPGIQAPALMELTV